MFNAGDRVKFKRAPRALGQTSPSGCLEAKLRAK